MAHALRLGRMGLGTTWPNPSVGCVIVKGGRIVGRGRTAEGGRPHAETRALAQAGAAARGATVYVTLEPCAHHGSTPPCADALVAAGVSRVVVATTDKDPRVDGAGLARLREAGIAVEKGLRRDEALRDHAGFFLRTRRGRPALTLKLALSLDGRIATATGESRWITGAAARVSVHALRASHDAVLVGGGTARADDPDLTVRGFGAVRQPVRVVVSRSASLPLSSRLARTARDIPVWICHGTGVPAATRSGLEAAGVTLLPCDTRGGRVDPASVLDALGAAGVTRVFCEGGGQLAASLIAADLVDELHVFSAGVVLGAEGQPALGALGIERLDEAPRFDLLGSAVIGADVHHVWRRRDAGDHDFSGA